jgi:phosphatidyl-myo-inositol dimannoside synthase
VGAIDDADVTACLSAADVFVMPARSRPPDVEGFGLVFLEANACGRPVVGADAGGVPDAIVPGVTGELVPPDDPPALAGTLVYLLEDRAYAARLGRQGRERIERDLNWDRAAATVRRVLDGTA